MFTEHDLIEKPLISTFVVDGRHPRSLFTPACFMLSSRNLLEMLDPVFCACFVTSTTGSIVFFSQLTCLLFSLAGYSATQTTPWPCLTRCWAVISFCSRQDISYSIGQRNTIRSTVLCLTYWPSIDPSDSIPLIHPTPFRLTH